MKKAKAKAKPKARAKAKPKTLRQKAIEGHIDREEPLPQHHQPHSLAGVEMKGDKYVVTCSCGWKSKPAAHVLDARAQHKGLALHPNFVKAYKTTAMKADQEAIDRERERHEQEKRHSADRRAMVLALGGEVPSE